jgi:hypothetical protein
MILTSQLKRPVKPDRCGSRTKVATHEDELGSRTLNLNFKCTPHGGARGSASENERVDFIEFASTIIDSMDRVVIDASFHLGVTQGACAHLK